MSSFETAGAGRRLESLSGFHRWAPFSILLAMVAGAILVATFRWPGAVFAWIDRYPGIDKAGHFLLIGGLALALNWALHGRRVRLGRLLLQLGGLVIAAVITVEEFSQLWIPARSFDWADLAANYAGIASAGWLARRRLR